MTRYLKARALIKKLQALVDSCPHAKVHKPRKSESAHCEDCGKNLGWYCPESPKQFCEYDEENDPCLDDCIHCHMPEERK